MYSSWSVRRKEADSSSADDLKKIYAALIKFILLFSNLRFA